jgi:hypothetical protein
LNQAKINIEEKIKEQERTHQRELKISEKQIKEREQRLEQLQKELKEKE